MITLNVDQEVFGMPDWVVSEGGDYEPADLVTCYRVSEPAQLAAYQAQFIATGESA